MRAAHGVGAGTQNTGGKASRRGSDEVLEISEMISIYISISLWQDALIFCSSRVASHAVRGLIVIPRSLGKQRDREVEASSYTRRLLAGSFCSGWRLPSRTWSFATGLWAVCDRELGTHFPLPVVTGASSVHAQATTGLPRGHRSAGRALGVNFNGQRRP